MLSLPAEGWEVEGVEGVEDVKYPFIEKGLTLFCMSPFYLNFSFASSHFNPFNASRYFMDCTTFKPISSPCLMPLSIEPL